MYVEILLLHIEIEVIVLYYFCITTLIGIHALFDMNSKSDFRCAQTFWGLDIELDFWTRQVVLHEKYVKTRYGDDNFGMEQLMLVVHK